MNFEHVGVKTTEFMAAASGCRWKVSVEFRSGDKTQQVDQVAKASPTSHSSFEPQSFSGLACSAHRSGRGASASGRLRMSF